MWKYYFAVKTLQKLFVGLSVIEGSIELVSEVNSHVYTYHRDSFDLLALYK